MSRAALCALFAFSALPLAVQAAERSAVGDWSGALHQGDGAYRVRFHVQTAADGRLTGLVSGLPGDGATAAPAAVEALGDRLVIDVAGGRYSGVWDQGRGEWVGAWKQADLSEPLALRWDGDSAMRTMANPGVAPVVPVAPPHVPAGGVLR